MRAPSTAGPRLPATPAISRRGPRVKPFTPDPAGSSGRDPLVMVTISGQRSTCGGAGRDRDAKRA
jgi:hypothetical protein